MSGAPTPPFIPEAFAAQADPGFINTIPDTSVDPQRASYELGFPPLVMTPILGGGKPMLGPDMNGILYALSSHTVFQQTGKPYVYSSNVSTAIGGYTIGTVLGMADGSGLWMSTVDANTTNPDGGSSAGWTPIASFGFTSFTSTGGTVTLTEAQARRGTIVVQGALVANLQVNFPVGPRRWLIVNTTSGAFTVTAKTPSGTGVTIPQGGFPAPVEVYGDGTNLYPTVAPLTIPSDVGPSPNTYVVRSNNGYVYATYFNQNSPLENLTASAVFFEFNNDGFHRKITPANLAAQIALSLFAGQVTAPQVPPAAVTQYAALILANAALTGTPTSTTPPAGDNSTHVATTAFVNGALTPTPTNGSMTFPGGLILKWGFAQSAGAITAVAFATPFPTAVYAAVCSTANRTAGGASGTNFVSGLTVNGMNCAFDVQQIGPGTGNRGGYWFAIGT